MVYVTHKAIISSDLPVLREVLNQNSLLVEHDNSKGWIDGIEILKNPLKRNKISFKRLKILIIIREKEQRR